MNRKRFVKIALIALVIVSLVACFVACDAFGGKGKYKVDFMDGDTILDSKEVEPGEKVALPTPSKDGYSFVGWYKDAALSDPYVADSTVEDNMTLYAKFAVKTMYVTVNSNGGSAVEKVAVTTGSAYSVSVPVREGYDFVGYTYYDEDTDETKEFAKDGTYTFNSSIRVTANWQIKKYNVKFVDGNSDYMLEAEHGKTVTLEQRTKTGYTFIGWFNGETKFEANTPVVENVTLTAKYVANTYTVSVNANGGEVVSDQTVTYGGEYELPVPVRTGYTFVGYTLNSGEEVALEGVYERTEGIRVTANWEIKSFTVTFVGDGEDKTATVEYGSFAALPEVAVGYEVKAVYSDEEKANAVVLAETAITDDVVFYITVGAKQFTITVKGLPKGENTFTADYNGTYTLTEEPVKEGYLFAGYIDDDEQEFSFTGSYTWTADITVTAKFVEDPNYNKVVITLKDGDIDLATRSVEIGADTVDLSSVNTVKTGYTFDDWYIDEDCTIPYIDGAVTFNANITLYAGYTVKSYTIYIDEDGAVATDDVVVDYNGSYELPDLTKKGYTFVGYKRGDAAFAQSGTYTIDENSMVVAQWTRNEVTVTFMNGANTHYNRTIFQYQTIADANPSAPEKTGYTFSKWQKAGVDFALTDEIAEDTVFDAAFTANTYKITLDYGDTVTDEIDVTYDAEYTLPENPIKAGMLFKEYLYNSVAFDAVGTYSYAENIIVVISWNADTNLFVEENKYFKERQSTAETFVYTFLTGITYDFSTYYSKVETLSESVSGMFYKDGDSKFTPAKVGTFTLKLTPKDGEAYERNAKVVEYLNTFNLGADYSGMKLNAASSTVFHATTDAITLDVGKDNFIVDITAMKNLTDVISLEDANVTLTVTDAGQAVGADKYSLTGSTVSFDSSLVGKTLALTFSPKYALAENNIADIVLNVKVNDGVNVYTNEDLKREYANANNTTINILRNIKAELVDTDYYTDKGGSGKHYGNVTLTQAGKPDVTLENIDLGTPKNNFNAGVYVRITSNKDDNLVLNGNHFSIDGSKLPYIDNRYDRYGADGSKFTDGNSYRIANVQIGIFLYACTKNIYEGSTECNYASGHVDFNNLAISGNNIPAYSAYSEDLGDGKMPLLKMSASYIGIVLRGGTINMDNVTITNAIMGIMEDGGISGYTSQNNKDKVILDNETQSAVINMNNCIVDKCWANSIYTYDLCVLNIRNTDIGQSYGAAISMDDIPYGNNAECDHGNSTLNSVLTMDVYTSSHVNNFVSGEEAWFVAYGQSGLATQVKTTVEAGISQATSGTMTIIRTIDSVEKMNFVVFVRSAGDYPTEAWTADKDGCPDLDVLVYNDAQATGGMDLFYGDTADMANLGSARPYYPVSTAMLGAEYNNVMLVWLPVYTK